MHRMILQKQLMVLLPVISYALFTQAAGKANTSHLSSESLEDSGLEESRRTPREQLSDREWPTFSLLEYVDNHAKVSNYSQYLPNIINLETGNNIAPFQTLNNNTGVPPSADLQNSYNNYETKYMSERKFDNSSVKSTEQEHGGNDRKLTTDSDVNNRQSTTARTKPNELLSKIFQGNTKFPSKNLTVSSPKLETSDKDALNTTSKRLINEFGKRVGIVGSKNESYKELLANLIAEFLFPNNEFADQAYKRQRRVNDKRFSLVPADINLARLHFSPDQLTTRPSKTQLPSTETTETRTMTTQPPAKSFASSTKTSVRPAETSIRQPKTNIYNVIIVRKNDPNRPQTLLQYISHPQIKNLAEEFFGTDHLDEENVRHIVNQIVKNMTDNHKLPHKELLIKVLEEKSKYPKVSLFPAISSVELTDMKIVANYLLNSTILFNKWKDNMLEGFIPQIGKSVIENLLHRSNQSSILKKVSSKELNLYVIDIPAGTENSNYFKIFNEVSVDHQETRERSEPQTPKEKLTGSVIRKAQSRSELEQIWDLLYSPSMSTLDLHSPYEKATILENVKSEENMSKKTGLNLNSFTILDLLPDTVRATTVHPVIPMSNASAYGNIGRKPSVLGLLPNQLFEVTSFNHETPFIREKIIVRKDSALGSQFSPDNQLLNQNEKLSHSSTKRVTELQKLLDKQALNFGENAIKFENDKLHIIDEHMPFDFSLTNDNVPLPNEINNSFGNEYENSDSLFEHSIDDYEKLMANEVSLGQQNTLKYKKSENEEKINVTKSGATRSGLSSFNSPIMKALAFGVIPGGLAFASMLLPTFSFGKKRKKRGAFYYKNVKHDGTQEHIDLKFKEEFLPKSFPSGQRQRKNEKLLLRVNENISDSNGLTKSNSTADDKILYNFLSSAISDWQNENLNELLVDKTIASAESSPVMLPDEERKPTIIVKGDSDKINAVSGTVNVITQSPTFANTIIVDESVELGNSEAEGQNFVGEGTIHDSQTSVSSSQSNIAPGNQDYLQILANLKLEAIRQGSQKTNSTGIDTDNSLENFGNIYQIFENDPNFLAGLGSIWNDTMYYDTVDGNLTESSDSIRDSEQGFSETVLLGGSNATLSQSVDIFNSSNENSSLALSESSNVTNPIRNVIRPAPSRPTRIFVPQVSSSSSSSTSSSSSSSTSSSSSYGYLITFSPALAIFLTILFYAIVFLVPFAFPLLFLRRRKRDLSRYDNDWHEQMLTVLNNVSEAIEKYSQLNKHQ